MPTRDEFLASPGLVSQITEAGTICAICHDEATNPVMTSGCECRVLYCQECILDWFQFANRCCTCRAIYYEDDDIDDDMSESDPDDDIDDDMSDDDNEPGPPTFGLNATVRNFAPNGEGDEVIYLLDLYEMGEMATPETEQVMLQQIHDFRFFDNEYNPANASMTKQAYVDAYLLIDPVLADANMFYNEHLEGALQGSEGADEDDFFLLVETVGQVILDFHGQRFTFEECHQQLLQEVLGDLRHESPMFQELSNSIEAQGETMNPNPLHTCCTSSSR